jgi:hypothetical protein
MFSVSDTKVMSWVRRKVSSPVGLPFVVDWLATEFLPPQLRGNTNAGMMAFCRSLWWLASCPAAPPPLLLLAPPPLDADGSEFNEGSATVLCENLMDGLQRNHK